MPFDATLGANVLSQGIVSAGAVAPLDAGHFLCYGSRKLSLVDEGAITTLCEASLPHEKDSAWAGHHLALRIHVSSNGGFAALCHDFGRYGAIIDIKEKRLTLKLDKGEYRNEHTPFPVAFFDYAGSTLLVHATNWNRLDVSDPKDGAVIMVREFSSPAEGQRTPEHYSGFWHGQLYVSENSQWIADDQWCWGPAGEVTTWNLGNWLEDNVWESEDGNTRQRLCQRIYLWNIPVV